MNLITIKNKKYMENTLENKAKFMAQHWGQTVLRYSGWRKGIPCSDVVFEEAVKGHFLELKSLAAISKEDLAEIVKIFDLSEEEIIDTDLTEWLESIFDEPAGYFIDGYTGNQILAAIDFLRSKGYALPFMGLSVESQISYGWVKLAEVC